MEIRKAIRRIARRDRTDYVAPEEHVVFFPTAANISDGCWVVPIHGWIYRRADLSRLRRLGLWLARRFTSRRAKVSAEEMKLFMQRAASFLADNNRRRRVQVQIGNHICETRRSSANGHFNCEARIPRDELRSASQLSYEAILRPGDKRYFCGQSFLLPEEGLSVISDIDDTVKITEVADRRKMLRHTFLENFAGVPEMAALYRQWAGARGAAFHYVSASPWHLYPFLTEFLQSQGFPSGTFHLRDFRLMFGDFHRTLRPSRRIKLGHARELLRRYPRRRFILVGDSGEADSRIYAGLFRDHPDQIERICIRRVAATDQAKCERALNSIPARCWCIFEDPAELSDCVLKK